MSSLVHSFFSRTSSLKEVTLLTTLSYLPHACSHYNVPPTVLSYSPNRDSTPKTRISSKAGKILEPMGPLASIARDLVIPEGQTDWQFDLKSTIENILPDLDLIGHHDGYTEHLHSTSFIPQHAHEHIFN